MIRGGSKLTGPHGLTGGEIDTLRKLARAYPVGVEDGDIPSKAGRSDLIQRGFARYDNGINYATREGVIAEAGSPPPAGSRADIADRLRSGHA